MAKHNSRLARIEQELAANVAQRDGPMITALLAFIDNQPEPVRHSFMRVLRQRYGGPGDTDASVIAMCGGVLTVTAEDRATFQRLSDEFFGGYGGAPDPLDPAPAPVMELA